MKTMSGAQILISLLERQGITTIAGIPGGANLPMYDALQKSRVIRHVLARHEQGAGFISQGMARASGKPSVCFATSGPGATNILTAIADAYLDSIPVICITGQVPRSMMGTDAFQEVDTYGMSIPITKHNFLIRSIEEMFEIIPKAFTIAMSGRPGPVLIDIPKDVQTATMEFEEIGFPGSGNSSNSILERCANAAWRVTRWPPVKSSQCQPLPSAPPVSRRWTLEASRPPATAIVFDGSIPCRACPLREHPVP